MAATTQRAHDGSWNDEASDLVRALSGAFLFGMPLLFTMEMWWIGEHLERARLGGFIALAVLVNSALAYFAGFRREGGVREALAEGIETMAIGVVVAVATLAVLQQLHVEQSLEAMLGMVALQAIPLSLGASVANIVFSGSGRRGLDDSKQPRSHARALADDVLATAAGAVFIGFSIAPTEEVQMLAVSLSSGFVLSLLAAFTLVVTYLIVFASGFSGTHGEGAAPTGYFQGPLSETVLAYVVALVMAALLLIGFGQITLSNPSMWMLTQIVVLAVPAAVGGAAGRIVV